MNTERIEEWVAVVAVRDTRAEGLEVFLFQDPHSKDYGFPKGRVQDVDAASRVAIRCHGILETTARKRLDHRKPPLRCLGHWVAASRILFIHTGVLFCTAGDTRTPMRPETRSRLLEQRPRLEKHEVDLVELLEAENLFCDLRRVVPFGKWLDSPNDKQTSQMQSFLCRLACEHGADSYGHGHAMSQWLSPEAVMVEWQRGQISLDFGTFGCLRVLADFRNTEDLFLAYQLAER